MISEEESRKAMMQFVREQIASDHEYDDFELWQSCLTWAEQRIREDERRKCADYAGRIASMMEQGAGECNPGERLRQVEHTIRAGKLED